MPPNTPINWDKYKRWYLLPVAVWLILLIGILYLPIPLYSGQFNDDPDNYMRADQVRDWLDGSHNWFDTTQWRIDPAPPGQTGGGADVFSRLVDLPLAGIAVLAKPYLGLEGGIRFAAFVVPFMVLLPLLFIVIAWVFRPLIGSASWLVAALAIAYPGVGIEFMPGRIDHHNYQILLFALSLGVVIRLLLTTEATPVKHIRCCGLILALSLALSLAIGVEALPWLGLLLAAFGYALWQKPQYLRPAAYAFAIAAPVIMALLLIALRTPVQIMQPTLHTVSLLSLKLVLAAAAVFALTGWVGPRINNLWRRGAVFALIAMVVSAALLLDTSTLLQGPFLGFDPWLIAFTKARVGEMQPMARHDDLWPWIEALIVVTGFMYWQLWKQQTLPRPVMILLAGLSTLLGVLTLFYAARLDRFWWIMALPGLYAALVWLKAALVHLIEQRPRLVIAGALLFAFAPVVVLLCLRHQPTNIQPIASLTPRCDLCIAADFLNTNFPEPQRILAYGTVAPELIWRTANTGHSVIGGGIYNNGAGLKAARHFFVTADVWQAVEILRAQDIDLIYVRDLPFAASVLANQTDDDYDRPLHANDPNAMIQRLHRGERFPWLTELPVMGGGGRFTIYRVNKDSLPVER